uniref:Uncharacterized protein n=1 Tax=Chromera velia CCMP2878 TaxID=1169474 RepID=A0A0G4HY95_9ALVE|eukprot:Cvel_9449.t1-p1 / transcript=Cvel_9449.t1 / gene=Cvel_9449 / organism=Chromera_velia_CCMP2878 / gene_product=hypothetical protein / transcript_product=hypothetical protein / location=Cvel_scaffold545:25562-35173(+) / protein_length=676 / sequence_SO=supercontig / SO=protein_coding / is_pseudo=false
MVGNGHHRHSCLQAATVFFLFLVDAAVGMRDRTVKSEEEDRISIPPDVDTQVFQRGEGSNRWIDLHVAWDIPTWLSEDNFGMQFPPHFNQVEILLPDFLHFSSDSEGGGGGAERITAEASRRIAREECSLNSELSLPLTGRFVGGSSAVCREDCRLAVDVLRTSGQGVAVKRSLGFTIGKEKGEGQQNVLECFSATVNLHSMTREREGTGSGAGLQFALVTRMKNVKTGQLSPEGFGGKRGVHGPGRFLAKESLEAASVQQSSLLSSLRALSRSRPLEAQEGLTEDLELYLKFDAALINVAQMRFQMTPDNIAPSEGICPPGFLIQGVRILVDTQEEGHAESLLEVVGSEGEGGERLQGESGGEDGPPLRTFWVSVQPPGLKRGDSPRSVRLEARDSDGRVHRSNADVQTGVGFPSSSSSSSSSFSSLEGDLSSGSGGPMEGSSFLSSSSASNSGGWAWSAFCGFVPEAVGAACGRCNDGDDLAAVRWNIVQKFGLSAGVLNCTESYWRQNLQRRERRQSRAWSTGDESETGAQGRDSRLGYGDAPHHSMSGSRAGEVSEEEKEQRAGGSAGPRAEGWLQRMSRWRHMEGFPKKNPLSRYYGPWPWRTPSSFVGMQSLRQNTFQRQSESSVSQSTPRQTTLPLNTKPSVPWFRIPDSPEKQTVRCSEVCPGFEIEK